MTLIIIAILIHGLFWFLTTDFLNRHNFGVVATEQYGGVVFKRADNPKQTNRYNLIAGFWWWFLWPLALIIAIVKLVMFIIKGGNRNG